MAFSRDDAIWLAGLLEGEGSFFIRKGSPKIALQMTDRDVVARAATIMGTKINQCVSRPKGKPTYKPVYSMAVFGQRAVSWMMIVFRFMGERRQAKIAEVMAEWRRCPGTPKASRGHRTRATCHPDRPAQAFGKCSTCYMRDWRSARRQEIAS